MIGGILIKLAFVFALLSVAGYIRHHLKGTDRSLIVGRLFFHGTVVMIVLGSATLLYLILTHQFQYSYVWSYSSRALSTPLLISTFYAGQEGSFMLWALFTAVIGICPPPPFFACRVRSTGHERLRRHRTHPARDAPRQEPVPLRLGDRSPRSDRDSFPPMAAA